jgi:thiol:disulfide interchange protein
MKRTWMFWSAPALSSAALASAALASALGLAGFFALGGRAQEAPESIVLQVVKYAGLKEVIAKNRGKVILVDFWADFCVPCKKGFPRVVAMHKKYCKGGLAVVSVSLDPIDNPGSRDNALKFLKKAGAEFTNLYLEEPAELWQKRLGFPGPPCYFVFNRQGQWTKFEAQDNVAVDYGAMETFIVERLRDK